MIAGIITTPFPIKWDFAKPMPCDFSQKKTSYLKNSLISPPGEILKLNIFNKTEQDYYQVILFSRSIILR